MDCIVLDAMGVIFKAADDVAELLVPFVREHGGESDCNEIEKTYFAASLGEIDADEFWAKMGFDPGVEDNYLSRHALVDGLVDFLRAAKSKNIPVWCLSNDVERWSRKLRASFTIDQYLQGSVISGSVGVRKPSTEIYEILAEKSGFSPRQMLFFDDREKNIAAARSFGMESVLFDTSTGFQHLSGRLRAGAL